MRLAMFRSCADNGNQVINHQAILRHFNFNEASVKHRTLINNDKRVFTKMELREKRSMKRCSSFSGINRDKLLLNTSDNLYSEPCVRGSKTQYYIVKSGRNNLKSVGLIQISNPPTSIPSDFSDFEAHQSDNGHKHLFCSEGTNNYKYKVTFKRFSNDQISLKTTKEDIKRNTDIS